MRRQTIKGAAIVAAVVAVIAGSDGIAVAVSGGRSAADSVTAAQMMKAVNEGSGIVGASEEGVPADFESLVFSTEGFGQLQHAPDGRIVGLVREGSPETVMGLCSERMQANGWTFIESGQSTRASFLKGEGAYRWAYVDCTAVGGDTSVVVVLDRGGENADSGVSQ